MKNKLILGFLAMLVPALSPAATHTVIITDSFQFSPEKLEIRSGDTVDFINKSEGTHTVTGDPARARQAGDIILPLKATPFHSGFLAPGKTFSQVFTVPGLYQYVCLPHELMGMKAQISVLPPR